MMRLDDMAVNKRSSRTARFALLLCAVLMAGFSPRAHSALLDIQTAEQPLQIPQGFGLRIGYMATDNVGRDPVDPRDARIGVLQLVANWEYLGSRTEAIVAGDLSYRNYNDERFDDEFRGNLFTGVSFDMLPDTLSWKLTNHYANTAVDPLETAGPENTQYYDVLETGPRLVLRPGRRHQIEVSAARARAEAEVSPVDHDRDTVFTAWTYDFTGLTDIFISAAAKSLTFDEELDAVDFDQQEALLGLESRRRNFNYAIQAGRSRIDMETGETRATTVGRLNVAARRTTNSRIYFYAARRLGDTTGLLNRELLEPGNIWSIAAASDPYIAKSAALTYTRGVRGRQWSAVLSGNRVDYFVSDFDRDQRGLRLNGELALTPNLVLDMSAARARQHYVQSDRTDKLSELRAGIDYRFDRRWSIITGLRHVIADSTNPQFEFKENYLTLFLNYVPRGRERARGAR